MITTSEESKPSTEQPSLAEMIGRRVASLRALHGMGQADLAVAVGLTQGTISRWERGEKMPSITTLATVADRLGCTVGYLVNGPEASSPLARADEMARGAERVA